MFVDSKLNNDNDGDDWVTVTQGSQASDTAIANADYDNVGAATNPTEGIDAAGRADITNVTAGQYLTFNLNSTGSSWVSSTGYTKLGLREGHDAINSAFTGTSGQYSQLMLRTSEYSGTTSDPILEVDYVVPTAVDTTYTYDQSGQRLTLSTGGNTTYYQSKEYNHTKQGSTITARSKHGFLAGTSVASIEGSGASAVIRHTYSDHLTGANVVTLASNGSIEEVVDYMPFGQMRVDQKTGSFSEQRKYAGHEFDAGTGLSYMGARYYDASIGRFLGQDAVFRALGDSELVSEKTQMERSDFLSRPQLHNSYSYVANNPLKHVDPNGEFLHVAIGMGVGAIAQYVTDVANNVTANGFKASSFTSNLSSGKEYGARALQGGAVAATGGLVIGAGAVATGFAIGGATTVTEVMVDGAMGRPADIANAAASGVVAALTAGVLKTVPKVPGRMPNFGTAAFAVGKHAQEDLAEIAIDVVSSVVAARTTDLVHAVLEETFNIELNK